MTGLTFAAMVSDGSFPLFGHSHGLDDLSGAFEETNGCILHFVSTEEFELPRFTGCFESFLGVLCLFSG